MLKAVALQGRFQRAHHRGLLVGRGKAHRRQAAAAHPQQRRAAHAQQAAPQLCRKALALPRGKRLAQPGQIHGTALLLQIQRVQALAGLFRAALQQVIQGALGHHAQKLLTPGLPGAMARLLQCTGHRPLNLRFAQGAHQHLHVVSLQGTQSIHLHRVAGIQHHLAVRQHLEQLIQRLFRLISQGIRLGQNHTGPFFGRAACQMFAGADAQVNGAQACTLQKIKQCLGFTAVGTYNHDTGHIQTSPVPPQAGRACPQPLPGSSLRGMAHCPAQNRAKGYSNPPVNSTKRPALPP